MFNGAYLKQLRLANNYTLNKLGEETGYTPSFLSQIERGLKSPSLTALRKIAECFSLPPTVFFHSASVFWISPDAKIPPVQVVKKELRHPMDLPDIAAKLESIPFLSPHPSGTPVIQAAACTLEPRQTCSEGIITHYKDQCIYVAKGSVIVHTLDRNLDVEEGDCFFIQADYPYTFENSSDEESVLMIFCV